MIEFEDLDDEIDIVKRPGRIPDSKKDLVKLGKLADGQELIKDCNQSLM